MARKSGDRYGATDSQTEYEGRSQARLRGGVARSVFSVAVAAVVLTLLVVWLFSHSAATNSAPSSPTTQDAGTARP